MSPPSPHHLPLILYIVTSGGPFSPPTSQGYKYFFTMVDDFSIFDLTFLLTQKSEVKQILTQFFTTIQTQFSKKIKAIRSDNGPEFNLSSLFSSFGTILQHSCVESPQQNARVKRKHQHLLNVARSLLFQSHLSLDFWGECILIASFLINRTSSSVLPNHITPFQALFNKIPDLSHLRVFGCLCFASTLDKGKHKFSPRASKCIFLGYPPGYKGYKVMDVTFHETHFPFSHLTSSFFPQSLHPDTVALADPSSSHTDLSSSHTDPSSSHTKPTPQTFTRSSRIIKQPSHLTDFVCNSVSSSSLYPISSYFSLSRLSAPYLKYIVLMSAILEPSTYKQAAQHPEWLRAMQEELEALIRNNT